MTKQIFILLLYCPYLEKKDIFVRYFFPLFFLLDFFFKREFNVWSEGCCLNWIENETLLEFESGEDVYVILWCIGGRILWSNLRKFWIFLGLSRIFKDWNLNERIFFKTSLRMKIKTKTNLQDFQLKLGR